MNIFILQNPIDITLSGAMLTIEELHISAPTGHDQGLLCRLDAERGKLSAGLMKISASFNDDDGEDPTEEEIAKAKAKEEAKDIDERISDMLNQFNLTGFDASKSMDIVKDLLCQRERGAKINGEKGMAAGHWDDMNFIDLKRIVAFYFLSMLAS